LSLAADRTGAPALQLPKSVTGRTATAVCVAVVSACLFCPNAGRCQSVDADKTATVSKPDDSEIPEANPARPTVTNPATLPPVGYLQFEQGFVQANESPELDRQFSVNQVTKIAVHSRLMFQFITQPFAVSVADGKHDTAEGDLDLGVQAVISKGEGRIPTVSAGYIHLVRGGHAADLDVGSFTQSAVLLASGDLRGFHYDTNFLLSSQESGAVRRAQFGQTLSVSHPLWVPKLGLAGEIWHFTQPFVAETYRAVPHPKSNAVGTLWTLSFTARPNLILDAGLERGLTVTSTQWQGFAGFTYVLPHRLWRRRDTPAKAEPKGNT
jgi:hypothetical protein